VAIEFLSAKMLSPVCDVDFFVRRRRPIVFNSAFSNSGSNYSFVVKSSDWGVFVVILLKMKNCNWFLATKTQILHFDKSWHAETHSSVS